MAEPKRKYSMRALHQCVLVVAVIEPELGEWSAYIKNVPGVNHHNEWEEVAKCGDKFPQAMAALLWPRFDKDYEWRR